MILIDKDGYRKNVGIILSNADGKLFWGKRFGMESAWQFPQGGIDEGEETVVAMYRELAEELGLKEEDVEILGESKEWLVYHLPKKFRRYDIKPLCIGQKQKWFLLRLVSDDSHVQLDMVSKPEFDQWQWVDYWYPGPHVIAFKREVYKAVLKEYKDLL